jgi:hypothetical protein
MENLPERIPVNLLRLRRDRCPDGDEAEFTQIRQQDADYAER